MVVGLDLAMAYSAQHHDPCDDLAQKEETSTFPEARNIFEEIAHPLKYIQSLMPDKEAGKKTPQL